jgi:hypothetical protein
MNKLVAVIVASTFALGSAAGFAADTAKKEELTKEEKGDMRARAEKLTAARAQGVPEHHVADDQTKAKKHHTKSKKETTPAPAVK